ncbi:MAG: VCBS repeat-containing protein, partial [Myxococcales bacterium]|nr:VCBS repeat-containing protein [Myxococcales bacterium]
DDSGAPPDMGMGGAPGDVGPPEDLGPPVDMGPPPAIAPTCEILSPGVNDRLTRAEETTISLAVADRDSALDALTVTLGGDAIELDAQGRFSGTYPLPADGETTFTLRVVDPDELTCETSVTVVSDRVAPRIQRLNPPPGRLLHGQPTIRVTGDVEDSHFAPELAITLRGAPFAGNVDWMGRSFGFDAPLEGGDNLLTVAAVDALGNQGTPQEVTIVLDNTPPDVVVTEPAEGFETAEAQVAVRGRIETDGEPEARSRVTITVTGPAGEATFDGRASAAGAFAITVDLQPGVNSVEVCGDDEAGNLGCTTIEVTRIDDSACIAITVPQDGTYVPEPTVRVAGTVCPAVTEVVLRVGEDGAEERPMVQNGEFSAFLQVPQAGRHTIFGVATTDEGDSADASIEVIFDPSDPTVRITEPNAGVCVNTDMVNVCGTARDPESGIASVMANGVAAALQPGGTFCQMVPVAPGDDVELTVEGTNGAGRDAETTRSIRVDVTPPVVAVTPASDAWLGVNPMTRRVQIPGRVTDDICGVTRLTIDGQLVGLSADGRFTYAQMYADGPQSVRLEASDQGGNVETVNYSFRVDQTPPVIDDLQPGEQVTITDPQVAVCVRVRDAGSGVTRVSIGGQDAVLEPQGGQTAACRTIDLPEGLTEVPVVVYDLVGNTVSTQSNIFRDVTGPVVELTFPPEGASVPVPTIVEGTADDGELGAGVAWVEVNGVRADLDPLDNSWRAVDVPVDPEDPVLTVRANDFNGNLSDPAATRAVVVEPYASYEPAFEGLRDFGDFGAANEVTWIGVADLNADGRLDLVALAGDALGRSSVFLQQADGTFSGRDEQAAGLPPNVQIRDAAMGDLNADGRPDVVIVGNLINGVWLGTNLGGFARLAVSGISPNLNARSVALGDINRDGALDALIQAGAGSRMYLGQGDGSFEPEPLTTFNMGDAADGTDAVFVDLDKDDTPDLVSVRPAGSELWFGVNGPFDQADPATEFPTVGAATVAVLDADRDGDLDVLTGGADGARFYINDDAGSFVTGALGLTWAAGDIGARVADLDGDARDDLIVYGADGLKVWFNRLAGFERADEASLGLTVDAAVSALAVVDLDGDGDHDLIVGTAEGVQVLRSHLSLLQAADYRWALLDIRRAVQLAPGPRDAVGAVLY